MIKESRGQSKTEAITHSWRPGKLLCNGGSLLVWMLLRAGAQAAIVVLLARLLGAQAYGELVAGIAVAGFATPLVGLGLAHMVLRNGAQAPEHLRLYFNRALQVWAYSYIPFTALVYVVALWLLPSGLPQLALFAVIATELAVSSLAELLARTWQAKQKTHAYGAINACLPLVRLLTLIFFVIYGSELNIKSALWLYAGANGAYLTGLLVLIALLPKYKPESSLEPMSITSGLPFCAAGFALKMQGEFNKPILARTGADLAGSYNIAQRAVDLASLPLQALQEALWPRLYSQPNPMRQLLRTGMALLFLAMILSSLLWLAAPLLTLVFGDSYSDAVDVLRLIVLLPILQLFRALLNFHAIHYGNTQRIGWAAVLGGIVSVATITAWVPIFGLAGAVAASYATEVAMILLLGGLAIHARHCLYK